MRKFARLQHGHGVSSASYQRDVPKFIGGQQCNPCCLWLVPISSLVLCDGGVSVEDLAQFRREIVPPIGLAQLFDSSVKPFAEH